VRIKVLFPEIEGETKGKEREGRERKGGKGKGGNMKVESETGCVNCENTFQCHLEILETCLIGGFVSTLVVDPEGDEAKDGDGDGDEEEVGFGSLLSSID